MKRQRQMRYWAAALALPALAALLLTLRASEAEGQPVHVIAAGETLPSIARGYGLPLSQVMQANRLPSPEAIYVGQVLLLPTEDAPTDPEALIYTAQPGDTLARVALLFGVPLEELMQANDLGRPGAVQPGQRLRVPLSGAGTAAGAAELQAPARRHVVSRGETLARIAAAYQVPIEQVISLNGLANPDRIEVGQVLLLPGEPDPSAEPQPAQPRPAFHTVAPDESLASIAARYEISLHALAVANGISSPARIYPGLMLAIPSAEIGLDSLSKASYGPGLCEGVTVERAGSGYFTRPVRQYTFTQGFGAWHPGVDLAHDSGSEIYAADGGTVIYAGWNPAGYGNLIVLDHGNGWLSYYAHFSSINVGCGQWLRRGSLLGAMGSTGNSTGPHLHFELLRFGVPVDPRGYLRF